MGKSNKETVTYDLNRVVIVVANILIDGGFADDDVLDIETNADDFGFVVGAGGDVGRYATNDTVSLVTLRLLQGSRYNDLLAAVRTLDVNTPGGAGVGMFSVKDLDGRSLYLGSKCWIAGPPKKVTFAKEIKTREWKFVVSDTLRVDGGNNPLGGI